MLTAFSDWFQEVAEKVTGPDAFWYMLGFVGQAVFTMRFVVQWIASERQGRSVIPVAFWFLSIFGSLIVLVYSVYRNDPVFVLAYSFNSLIYGRNLMLLSKEKKREREAAAKT